MSSKANELAARLKRFATRIVIFARAMPSDLSAQVLAKQLTGSGTAESANYHAARRGRSRAEFIAKLGVAAEEADETEHWLTVIRDAHIMSTARGLKELDWDPQILRFTTSAIASTIMSAAAYPSRCSRPCA